MNKTIEMTDMEREVVIYLLQLADDRDGLKHFEPEGGQTIRDAYAAIKSILAKL